MSSSSLSSSSSSPILLLRLHKHILLLVVLILSSLSTTTNAILHPRDFLSLQSIRSSLSDAPGSTFFATWDFTSDPCTTFAGVYCIADRVATLNLGNPAANSNGLTGHLHPAIGDLTSLTELTIVPGHITGPIPSTITHLTSLRFLAAPHNRLTGSLPAGLTSLTTLDLSFNLLTGPIIGSLPPHLTTLILHHNHLTSAIPSPLPSTLTHLSLSHNDFTSSIPSPLPPRLTYLSLSFNSLTSPLPSTFPTHLSHIDLSSNLLTGPVPSSLLLLPLLSTLLLNRNFLSGPLPLYLPQPLRLTTLDLGYNRLTGVLPPSLSTVQNLYLNNNRFYGTVPRIFADRLIDGTIRTLFLQHNFLSRMEIDPRAELPDTGVMCLRYNCMVPPVQGSASCPPKSGPWMSRPAWQCGWRRG